MYTNTTKDPDPVSRFIPLCYPRFPTSLKKKKNPITNPRTGYRQPSFVSRSLARSLDPKKNATECPTTPTQNADTIKKTPFDRQCRPDFPKARRQMKKVARKQREKTARGNKQARQLYLSFSTTRMTEMLKVASHATRLIMRTPPSAFCL